MNIIDKFQMEIGKGNTDIEQTLIDYLKSSGDEELLTMMSSTGKTLIVLALDNRFEKFLCMVLEEFPKLATIPDDGGYGYTFLHYAAKMYGLSDVLIKALEVNPKKFATIQDKDNNTFLHSAAEKGMEDVLMKALEIDPSLATIQNHKKKTFLHYAAVKVMRDVLIKALEVDPSLATIQDGRYRATFLHYAAEEGMKDVLMKALEVDPSLATIHDIRDLTFASAYIFKFVFSDESSKSSREKMSLNFLIDRYNEKHKENPSFSSIPETRAESLKNNKDKSDDGAQK